MKNFVTDFSEDTELGQFLVEHTNSSIQIEPIYATNVKTSLQRVTIDESIGKIPKHLSYIPFNVTITSDNYDQDREDLDKEIVTALTGIPVRSITKTMSQGVILLEFFISGEPLWINPNRWNEITQALEISASNIKFMTSNPLIRMHQSLEYVIKHPQCDVWMVPRDVNTDMVDFYLQQIKQQGIFYVKKIHQYESLYDEIIKAYNYQRYGNIEEGLYLMGDNIFDSEFFNYAVEEAWNGRIPFLSINFYSNNIPKHMWKASFIQAYIDVIKNYIYYTPETISELDVIDAEGIASVSQKKGGVLIVSFKCHCKNVYTELMSSYTDPSRMISINVTDYPEDEIIKLRYKLSKSDIRSFVVNTEDSKYVFANVLNLEEISDDLKTFTGLNASIPDIYTEYNNSGYYTFGPLKGIADNPIYSPFINPLEEHIIKRADGYYLIHKNEIFLGLLPTVSPDEILHMVKEGHFYSEWSKAYLQTFHEFSAV